MLMPPSLDCFGFYFELENGPYPAQEQGGPKPGRDEDELMKIYRECLSKDVVHSGSVEVIQSTVPSISSSKISLISSTCNGVIQSDGAVTCLTSTAKKIDAIGDVEITRSKVSESVESLGAVRISTLLCPLDFLSGDSLVVKSAELITKIKGATAFVQNSTIHEAILSESGTFINATILEAVSGTACRLELIGSTAKRLIFKKPCLIPGNERARRAEASKEFKEAAMLYKSCKLFEPHVKSLESQGMYAASLVNSEVEEILFDDLEGWRVELRGNSKLSRIGVLDQESYHMFEVKL